MWWYTLIIPATWDAEAGELSLRPAQAKKVETLSERNKKVGEGNLGI
jgi:hypothetical protein